MNVDLITSKNASTRRRRERLKKKKKRKSTRSKKKKRKSSPSKKKQRKSKKRSKSKRRKKKKRTKRSKSKKRKKSSINTKLTDKHEYPPMVTMDSIPQTFVPFNTTIDEKNSKKDFIPIARRRMKSKKINKNKSDCLCVNCNDSYSTLSQIINYVDFVKNILPCDENDTANFSKYEYELKYDEEHLFRC